MKSVAVPKVVREPELDVQVRGMQVDDWLKVRELIEAEWEAHHPVSDQDFFIWQHSGFGSNRGLHNTALAFVNDELIGMRGVIPGAYQIFDLDGKLRILDGGSFAMWIVAKDFRGKGVGGALLSHCEANLGFTVAVGSNESTSVPIYLKAGYKRIKGLHHWFNVFHPDGRKLIWGSAEFQNFAAERKGRISTELLDVSDPVFLAKLWEQFTVENRVAGLHRNAEFWTWRYLQHPRFRYHLHSNVAGTAVSVSRIEDVDLEGTRRKVLRLIEIISAVEGTNWSNHSGADLSFIEAVLDWARSQGCIAADFRSTQIERYLFLREAGFTLNRYESETAVTGFAGQLNPLDSGARPINVHWKVNAPIKIGRAKLYITKADNDMDRPNKRGVKSERLGN